MLNQLKPDPMRICLCNEALVYHDICSKSWNQHFKCATSSGFKMKRQRKIRKQKAKLAAVSICSLKNAGIVAKMISHKKHGIWVAVCDRDRTDSFPEHQVFGHTNGHKWRQVATQGDAVFLHSCALCSYSNSTQWELHDWLPSGFQTAKSYVGLMVTLC